MTLGDESIEKRRAVQIIGEEARDTEADHAPQATEGRSERAAEGKKGRRGQGGAWWCGSG